MDSTRPTGDALELGLTRSAGPSASVSQQQRAQKLQPVLILLGSFILIFTACGLTFSFGVYQALYEAMALSQDTPFTGASSAQISLIGTLSVSLMTMGAPFVTTWTKLYSPRAVVCIGGAVFFAAHLFSSISHRLWQFVLSQGLLLGMGACMAYIPAVTVAPAWFDKRRALAMGIIISGTGVGGVIWAPALRAMIDRMGFRNTMRVSSSVSFVLIEAAGYFMKWEPNFHTAVLAENQASTRSRGIMLILPINWHVLKSRKFAAQALGAMLQSAAYSTPLFFYAAYAKTLGYSEVSGANFIAFSNASNAVGKVVIGFAADRLGRLNTLFVTTFISAIAVLGFWIPSIMLDGGSTTSRGLFIAFTLLYGAFASAYISLFPASLIEIFGIQHFSNVNGVLYMIRGMAALVGTPVAGALIPTTRSLTSPESYFGAATMVGVLLAAATLAVLWVRMEAMLGSNWKWKL
ncbi:hypothetical protein OIDMADRAFT_35359 [Oidiodendron maius Zn]|uniref:Major facilitator superfamily (MFS) profile domain-containing protein n=1 Tax=Oidiodendron maius (strain Zn) TaxID=913774 RepID=A0A0C3GU31_OIDMZ|nr:hypothetical protein OIDMADRAFT_35359 [Oidiodendron maius Zn]